MLDVAHSRHGIAGSLAFYARGMTGGTVVLFSDVILPLLGGYTISSQ